MYPTFEEMYPEKVHAKGPIRMAVLGDLHGHFTLALSVLSRYQKESKTTLDLLLQVGDLGAWPNPLYRIDKTTWRFAQKDPDEISFPDYFDQREEYHLFKNPDKDSYVEAPFLFIRGNHEDFSFLKGYASQAESRSPAIINQDFFYIPNGNVVEMRIKGKNLRLAGLGGVEKASSSDDDGSEFEKREVHTLENLVPGDVDIFLAHEPPKGAFNDMRGSEQVMNVVHSLKPKYMFCGHYHEEGQRISTGVSTVSGYQLNDVNFKRRNVLNPGCIGILEWESPEKHSFMLLDESWMKSITRDNFRS